MVEQTEVVFIFRGTNCYSSYANWLTYMCNDPAHVCKWHNIICKETPHKLMCISCGVGEWIAKLGMRPLFWVLNHGWMIQHGTKLNQTWQEHIQLRSWRADCLLLAQRCRSHVFHVIDDVRDMRSWRANNKPRHNCAGEEMKWCRVWECWNYARAEICIVERELSKSVIGCSFSVGYQVYWRCLGVGADSVV